MILTLLFIIAGPVFAPESNTIPFDDANPEAKKLLAKYAENIGKASKDTTDYTGLKGILNTTEGRAMYYYTHNQTKGYTNEFRTVYRIKLKVHFTP